MFSCENSFCYPKQLNGCLLIWYGIWLLDSVTDQENAVDHGEKLAAILCLLLGSVIIVASIFGTVALFKECKRMLISVRKTTGRDRDGDGDL